MKPSILVVDDEPMMTEMVSMVLAMCLEAEIVVENDPRVALDILQSRDFSMLITDYFMPGVNGLDLIKKARTLGRDFPVIVLTGYYDSFELETGAAELGCMEIIVKPWSNDHLCHRVMHLLGMHPATH